MTKFSVSVKFDYRTFNVIVQAKTAQAAVNKAKRIWPCYTIFSAVAV